MSIRAVLFDIDDTLCDDTAQTYGCVDAIAARAAQRHPGIDRDALRETYLAIADAFWTRSISLAAAPPLHTIRMRLWRDAFDRVAPGLPDSRIEDAVAEYGRLRAAPLAPLPTVVPLLAHLKARGIRLGIVTNGLSETHDPKIDALGIGHFFDVALMPDRTGFAKPDARQFHLACARLGVAPHETGHVGDSPWSDVNGAVDAGLIAIWFNPNNRPLPENGARTPHYTIRCLSEIPAWLDAHARTIE